MTVRFGNNRLGFYIAVFLLSGTVLGLAAHFASKFLSDDFAPKGFIIFAIVVPSLNIFVFLLTLQWSQPRIETIVYFILGVLWLAMGAWSTDIVGHVQCDTIGGNQQIPGLTVLASTKSYCHQTKVVQAFSWALFAIFVIATFIIFQLVSQAQRFGRWNIWSEPIRELPWFGEMPGYYNTHTSGPAQMAYPAGYPAYGYPMTAGGHSVIVQPGLNGALPHVTTVPMSA